MLAMSRIAAGAMEERLNCILKGDSYMSVEFMEAADRVLGWQRENHGGIDGWRDRWLTMFLVFWDL